MANIKSAVKRVEVNEKKRVANSSQLSAMRTEIKRVEQLVEANEMDTAKAAFQTASKHIDKAAQRGIIHQNAANRQKSRLAKKINA
ncbi:30S ribosomal protein S20 [Oceanobacillus sp. J11TS1]|uniref:30S ribosomal protein S20 n=1 Tax=Oceanobacillus sp. J11TS1 TaxID=2807191 RepID=UPI001B23BF45|nr:30S ribosomal protein S20 [Oceanobacillus sp. J11TS1]GIO22069.1 30S ribosomal protein S20 [Oceanobacillus sp. J11TS1]